MSRLSQSCNTKCTHHLQRFLLSFEKTPHSCLLLWLMGRFFLLQTGIRSQTRNNHCSYQRNFIWWCSWNSRLKLIYVGQYCNGVIKSDNFGVFTVPPINYWNTPTSTDTILYYNHQKIKQKSSLLEVTGSLEAVRGHVNAFLMGQGLFYRKFRKILKKNNRQPLCKFPHLLSSSLWNRLNVFFLIFFFHNTRNTTDSLIFREQLLR